MASKKLKKALKMGLAGAALAGIGAKMKQAGEMKKYLAEEGGSKAQMFSKPNMAAVAGKAKTMLPKKKPSGSSYADVLGGYDDFGLGAMDGAKAGKMIKARGGKMVNLKPTKLY
jgi:hypothetical protein